MPSPLLRRCPLTQASGRTVALPRQTPRRAESPT